MRDRSREQSGFTLIEVTVVVAILTFGLLALSSMQLQAMKGGSRGRHATQAQTIAQTHMERLQRLRWTSLATTGWTAAVSVAPAVQGNGGSLAQQTYSRSHRITDLTADWTRTVDVRVTWNEPSGETRSMSLSSIRFNREAL